MVASVPRAELGPREEGLMAGISNSSPNKGCHVRSTRETYWVGAGANRNEPIHPVRRDHLF